MGIMLYVTLCKIRTNVPDDEVPGRSKERSKQ